MVTNFRLAALVLLVAVTTSACYTMKTGVPAGSNVTLAAAGDTCREVGHKRVHYGFWGLYTAQDNTTAGVTPASGKVRFISKATFLDGFLTKIGFFFTLGLYGGSHSLIVEQCD